MIMIIINRMTSLRVVLATQHAAPLHQAARASSCSAPGAWPAPFVIPQAPASEVRRMPGAGRVIEFFTVTTAFEHVEDGAGLLPPEHAELCVG